MGRRGGDGTAVGVSRRGIHDPAGGLPLDGWAMWVSEWTRPPAYWFTVTLLPLAFPTGRLLSRRWWPSVAGAVPASAITSVGRARRCQL